MSVTLQEILMPQVVLDLVSRVKKRQGALGRWLGFQPTKFDPDTVSLSGPNTVEGPTRYPTYRIFDFTRVAAKFTAPGTPPVTVAPNPVGDVRVTCARMHEKIPLNCEMLSNLSPMIGPNSVIDPGGQNYIEEQINFIGQHFNNSIETMAAGMMRDSLYMVPGSTTLGGTAQQYLPSFTNVANSQQISFQVPAGNKNQLNLLGAGNIIGISWANLGAPIIDNCLAIEAAAQQLTGYQVEHVWVNSLLWAKVIQNTQVRNTAGSANVPFAEYAQDEEFDMNGEKTGKFIGVLRGLPWLKWHINDDVVVLNSDIDPSYASAPSTATFSKVIPDGMAIFCATPDPEWTKLYLGGEYVVENPGQPMVLRKGYWMWKEWVTQASGVDLIGLCNAIPMLKIPKIVMPAQVVYP